MVAIIFFSKKQNPFYQLCSDRLFWANLFSSPIVFGHPWSMESTVILPKALQAGHGCASRWNEKMPKISIVGREKMESNEVGDWLAHFWRISTKGPSWKLGFHEFSTSRKQFFFCGWKMGFCFCHFCSRLDEDWKRWRFDAYSDKYRNIYTYIYILDI